jgi:SWI/SNF-related matrix-associated actin-dependent regulator 1 of chromatin subfamily A
MTQIGDLIRVAAKAKMKYVVDWCNEFLVETEEKLIVFGHHKKCIDVLKRRINGRSVVVDGSVTGRKRQARIEQFKLDKNTRTLIGNLKAAGVGITLTESSTVVMAEMLWKPTDMTQAEDRAHRLGQSKSVWVYYFVAANTIEEDLCAILQDRQEIVSTTLDGGTKVDDLDIYDDLLKLIRKENNVPNSKTRSNGRR